jgi:hypothetical protein
VRTRRAGRNSFIASKQEAERVEHARDIAKGEIPNQKVKHFSRYAGMNEGEVASSYTYKKSVGRNNALNPENPSSQNFINTLKPENNVVKSKVNQHFETWYNDKTSETTIGKLLDDPAFSENGILDDVKDVKVRHSNTDKLPTDTPFNETHTLGGYVTIENGEVIIYTNTSQPIEMVEQNLYHELQHARDLNDAYLNPNATLEQRMEAEANIPEVMQAVKDGDEVAYKSSKYEKSADLNKDFLTNKKKDYYDRQNKSTNNRRSSNNNEVSISHERNNRVFNENRELNKRTSREKGLDDSTTILQGTTRENPKTTAREPIDPSQPVHEQLNNSKGDLNLVGNIVENQAGNYIKKFFYQYNENLMGKQNVVFLI